MGSVDREAPDAGLKAQRTRQRLQRAALHLHGLGPRALAELLLKVAERTGNPGAVLATVAEYEPLTPAKLALSGGDRMPPAPIRELPL